MRAFLCRLLVALFGAIILEQSVLFVIGRSLTSNPTTTSRFVADLTAGDGTMRQICLRYDVALIYYYGVCANQIPGREYYEVRLAFPAGYLTLIPRDYPDRSMFDGRTLAFVDDAGTIVE